jgi:hypothetical protein
MGHSSRVPGVAAGAAAALLVASLIGSPARTQEPERTPSPEPRVRAETRLVPQRQWEYRQLPCMPAGVAVRERGEFLDQLNDAGRHGWELVGIAELGAPGRECLLATLKRPVAN